MVLLGTLWLFWRSVALWFFALIVLVAYSVGMWRLWSLLLVAPGVCVGGHVVWGTYSLGGHEMGYKLFCSPLGVSSLAGVVGNVGESEGEGSHSVGSW